MTLLRRQAVTLTLTPSRHNPERPFLVGSRVGQARPTNEKLYYFQYFEDAMRGPSPGTRNSPSNGRLELPSADHWRCAAECIERCQSSQDSSGTAATTLIEPTGASDLRPEAKNKGLVAAAPAVFTAVLRESFVGPPQA